MFGDLLRISLCVIASGDSTCSNCLVSSLQKVRLTHAAPNCYPKSRERHFDGTAKMASHLHSGWWLLSVVLLLERQREKKGHGVKGKRHIDRPRGRPSISRILSLGFGALARSAASSVSFSSTTASRGAGGGVGGWGLGVGGWGLGVGGWGLGVGGWGLGVGGWGLGVGGWGLGGVRGVGGSWGWKSLQGPKSGVAKQGNSMGGLQNMHVKWCTIFQSTPKMGIVSLKQLVFKWQPKEGHDYKSTRIGTGLSSIASRTSAQISNGGYGRGGLCVQPGRTHPPHLLPSSIVMGRGTCQP